MLNGSKWFGPIEIDPNQSKLVILNIFVTFIAFVWMKIPL